MQISSQTLWVVRTQYITLADTRELDLFGQALLAGLPVGVTEG